MRINFLYCKEKITTAIQDADLILKWIEDLVGDEFSSLISKIEGVISDNASAAHKTRMTLIQRLNEKDPATSRVVVKCSGMIYIIYSFVNYSNRPGVPNT